MQGLWPTSITDMEERRGGLQCDSRKWEFEVRVSG